MRPMVFALIGSLGPIALAARADDAPARVVFRDVTVIDVEHGRAVAGRAVVVAGPRIEAVEPAEGFAPPAGATVVDASGKFLIPGLWDMHVHLDDLRVLPVFVANGVTGIREMNSPRALLAIREAIRAGDRVGPRIVAGLYTDATREPQPPDRPAVDTPEAARAWARRARREGFDFLKVYTGLAPEVYAALVEEAALQGLPVAGHCPEWVGAAGASRLGQRSLEHCTGLAIDASRDEAAFRAEVRALPRGRGYDIDAVAAIDARAFDTQDGARRAALFALLARNRTWQTPTLVIQRPIPAPGEEAPDDAQKYAAPGHRGIWARMQAFEPLRARSRDMHRRSRAWVESMHDAGVPLLAGTDLGDSGFRLVAGFSLHDELRELVGCGLAPAEALRAATLNPALYLGEEATSGSVGAGKRADLVLLDANPLDDIAHTRKIAGVYTQGRWRPRPDLDALLDAAAAELK